MKKALISGCCGFIGSHLCKFLLNKNYIVIGIDNLITGEYNNIKEIENNPNFNFIEHDICNEIKIKEKIDLIFHLASPASPKDYIKYPIETLKTNSLGTENLLKIALHNNANILVASTSEVYGDPLEHPQKETYFGNVNPIGTRGVYDEAKRYLEAITMAYHRRYKLNTKIVRIFNTYGPNMRKHDGRAIPNFVNQALENKDFTVYGNGLQTRSFTYIDDIIFGVYKLITSNYNEPINIGNPREISILYLIELIQNLIQCDSKIIFKKLPENDPKVRKPDISLAKKTLGWNPKTNLEDGLISTINYFRSNK